MCQFSPRLCLTWNRKRIIAQETEKVQTLTPLFSSETLPVHNPPQLLFNSIRKLRVAHQLPTHFPTIVLCHLFSRSLSFHSLVWFMHLVAGAGARQMFRPCEPTGVIFPTCLAARVSAKLFSEQCAGVRLSLMNAIIPRAVATMRVSSLH